MIPKLIDIHCHLDFPEFDPSTKLGASREEVIRRTLGEDVWMINIGTNLETSKKSIELAEKHEGVFASVGLHPNYADQDFDIEKYRELAKDSKVVTIGECGLDYSRFKNQDLRFKNLQKDVFKKQVELAIELDKSLMIHCRDSHEDVINILKSYFVNHKSKLRGNVHFFSGTLEQAEKYLDLGFSLSFTGVITFTKDYDEIIKNLPLEKIMVETDAPFVAPAPYRGQRCEPLYVKEVAKRIAEIRGMSYDEVAEITTKNALRFFNLA